MSQFARGQHDFDFLHGNWNVRSRVLARRLQGCTEWDEFQATQECYPVLGGQGNIDHFHGVLSDGTSVEGMSIRLFDASDGTWRIYWADNRHPEVGPPVQGSFTDGVGRFEGKDIESGQPVDVKFHWTDITADSAKWAQEFSIDGGKTWELNWEMYFTRQPS